MELKVNVNGVNYWYDEEDFVYKHDRFGYPSVTDISILPASVTSELQKLIDEE